MGEEKIVRVKLILPVVGEAEFGPPIVAAEGSFIHGF
jgi:hypothetical protein